MTHPMVLAAAELAADAHGTQLDKAGRPYLDHPARVAQRMDNWEDKTVAWLHDVLEDTSVTPRELEARGFPDSVIFAIIALTRQEGEGDDYYARVRANSLALKVKIADITDNCDPRRLVHLDDETVCRLVRKYAKALTALVGPLEGRFT